MFLPSAMRANEYPSRTRLTILYECLSALSDDAALGLGTSEEQPSLLQHDMALVNGEIPGPGIHQHPSGRKPSVFVWHCVCRPPVPPPSGPAEIWIKVMLIADYRTNAGMPPSRCLCQTAQAVGTKDAQRVVRRRYTQVEGKIPRLWSSSLGFEREYTREGLYGLLCCLQKLFDTLLLLSLIHI